MKKYLIVLFVLILTVMACSQIQQFPGRIVMNQYSYMSVLHTPIDTSDMEFQYWVGADLSAPFDLIGIVQAPDTQLVLLDTNAVYFPELYTGQNRYAFIVAHWISENTNAAPSDTTPGHFFPLDRPKRGYDIDIIDIPVRMD